MIPYHKLCPLDLKKQAKIHKAKYQNIHQNFIEEITGQKLHCHWSTSDNRIILYSEYSNATISIDWEKLQAHITIENMRIDPIGPIDLTNPESKSKIIKILNDYQPKSIFKWLFNICNK